MNLLTAITDFLRPKRAREREKQIEIQIAGFDSALQQMGDHYVTFEETDVMKAKWRETSLAIQHRRIRKRSPLYPVSRKFLNDYAHLSELTAVSNAAFVRAESERCNALLSDIDGKSLDAQQRTVVLTEEARTLVLAGAGSGKTLTILGKVKYLCRERGVAPEDILLISYTRASADEMSQKLHHLGLTRGNPPVTQVLEAVLSAVNVEKAEVMVPSEGPEPEIFREFRQLLGGMELSGLGRYEFYDACMADNAIVLAVSTGEQRVFANILLTIGCA